MLQVCAEGAIPVLPTRAVGRGASLIAELRKTKLDGTSQISGKEERSPTTSTVFTQEFVDTLLFVVKKQSWKQDTVVEAQYLPKPSPRRDGRCGLTHICTKQA